MSLPDYIVDNLNNHAVDGPWFTTLDPKTEQYFQKWVKDFNIPFNDSPTGDYDMRGYFQKYVYPRAQDLMYRNPPPGAPDPQIELLAEKASGVSAIDGFTHFTDEFKTPYHVSFSDQSIYAKPTAPRYADEALGILVNNSGQIVYDESRTLVDRYSQGLMAGIDLSFLGENQ